MSQYLDKDGASRIAENFLSKQAEQDAILKNLQFDLKEAEHALVKTIQGPAPLNIRALTRPLDNYVISGNTVQNGTPTPEVPVCVVGCGERTENLLNYHYLFTSDYDRHSEYFDYYKLILKPNTQYTFTTNAISSNDRTTFLVGISYIMSTNTDGLFNGVAKTITSNPDGSVYVARRIGGAPDIYVLPESNFDNGTYYIMLNTGSTALQYEPYGYKLPLTVNGTEYPIYLGQVPTTRRVKKLVLTGEETWYKSNTGIADRAFFATQLASDSVIERAGLCTHFVHADVYTATTDSGFIVISVGGLRIRTPDVATLSLDEFKQYLAAQYAAGTPVTVWYVLATPETGIANEPLMKIGDYADTISMAQVGVEISTTKGFNTITTDTTVLSSNIEVKGVINNA